MVWVTKGNYLQVDAYFVCRLLPLLSGQHLVCLDVLGTCLLNDLSRHLNTLNTLDTGLGQPVAQELLVVAVLATTDLVGGLQPEAGGVYKILATALTAFKDICLPGVRTSSTRTTSPFSFNPNSNLVSAMMIPFFSAC